ncbi:retrovirus-related pol polyprotein from transposon TNT 1-94 [Tanacetum coccineum]
MTHHYKALESIQKMADHSHKCHNEESDKNSTPLKMIAEKLKSLNHDMVSLREDVRKIHNGLHHEELETMRTVEYNNVGFSKNIPLKFGLRKTFERYLHESYKRQEDLNGLIKQECATKLEASHDIPFTKVETFAEKVKRKIIKDNENREKILRKLESEPVNAPLFNLPPKEKDPGSFILPCVIGNTTISNALVNLGVSISVMPFSMFKRLGLGNPKPINMMIKMANRSMQSPKGIVENVLEKDFFGSRNRADCFNANEGTCPLTVSPVCVINVYQVIDDLGGPEDLEEVLMNEDINEDLGNFLKENGLLPNFDGQKAISFSLSCSLEINKESFRTFQDSDNNMSIRIDDYEIDDLWDYLDLEY